MTADTLSALEAAEGVAWNVCHEPDDRWCTAGVETEVMAAALPERSPAALTEW